MKFDQWSLLALLRFLLATIVAINHLEYYAPLGALAVVPRFGAFEAILGFLLISGYSIGHSWIKEPAHFLQRRVARLYPVYLAAILISFAAQPQEISLSFVVLIALNALFLNQALTAVSYVGPAWSLSLEFWLYCLTPLFSRTSYRRLRLAAWTSFVAFCLYTCARTVLHAPYYTNLAFGLNLILLSFIWIAGFQLAFFKEQRRTTLTDIALFFTIHLGLDTAIQLGSDAKRHILPTFFSSHLPTFALHAATLLVVWFAFQRFVLPPPTGRPVRSRAFRFLGDISYPLYLVHVPIFAALARLQFHNPWLMFAIVLAVSAALFQGLDFYSKKRERLREAQFLRNAPPVSE